MNVLNAPQQDSAFYTYRGGSTVVWDNAEAPRFYVVSNGEMKILARKSLDFDYEVITNTDDLMSFGITTDADLAEWEAKGQDYFYFENNSWFEVCSTNAEDDDFYPIVGTLREGVELCERLQEMYGDDGEILWDSEKHDWVVG